jgi:hypothetical protein
MRTTKKSLLHFLFYFRVRLVSEDLQIWASFHVGRHMMIAFKKTMEGIERHQRCRIAMKNERYSLR